jgi:YHS domain-containing protein
LRSASESIIEFLWSRCLLRDKLKRIHWETSMKRLKYIGILSLLGLLLIAGLSFTNRRETKNASTPTPFTANPSLAANRTAEIKGESGKPQTIDIFSGKPVNRSVFTDYDGERIYFCCDVERQEFLKDPAFFLKKIRERGIILDPASKTSSPTPSTGASPTSEVKGEPGKPQTVDVFSGKPVVRSVYTDYDGERIYFCCDYEKGIFLKDPELNMQRIRDRGIILEPSPQ